MVAQKLAKNSLILGLLLALFPLNALSTVPGNPQVVRLYGADGGAINTTAGALNANFTGTVTTSNASVTTTGSAVPGSANYIGASKAGTFTGLLLGQQTMANSLACVLPSDQAAIPVSESGTWNITNVSGTVSLPTGASTSALQTTGNTSLASIDTKTPALGQALAASSVPVVLTASQLSTLTPLSTVAVTQSTSPWVSNTSQINGVTPLMGNGVTGTGSQRVTIASDNTAFSVNAQLKDGSGTSVTVGQKTMSSSLPVTIASDQVAPKTYANSAGSFVLNSTLTTVVSETAPANAVGFILQAKDSNAANIRWAVGATATTSSGMQLQPGRDTGFVPVAATVSVVAESGTLEYQLTWIKQ